MLPDVGDAGVVLVELALREAGLTNRITSRCSPRGVRSKVNVVIPPSSRCSPRGVRDVRVVISPSRSGPPGLSGALLLDSGCCSDLGNSEMTRAAPITRFSLENDCQAPSAIVPLKSPLECERPCFRTTSPVGENDVLRKSRLPSDPERWCPRAILPCSG
jgi:hypothetical protein